MNNRNINLLKQWIKAAGYKSIASFAADITLKYKAIHLDSVKMSNLFKGVRSIKSNEIDAFCDLLQKTPTDIREVLGENVENTLPILPLSGYVGAADRVVFFNNDLKNFSDENVQVPFFYYKGSLLEVRGESMIPRYSPGEIIGITKPDSFEQVHKSLLGKDVVVCLPNGRLLLKVIHQGSQENKYTLISINPIVPPIIDTEITWATTIDFHLPKARYI